MAAEIRVSPRYFRANAWQIGERYYHGESVYLVVAVEPGGFPDTSTYTLTPIANES